MPRQQPDSELPSVPDMMDVDDEDEPEEIQRVSDLDFKVAEPAESGAAHGHC